MLQFRLTKGLIEIEAEKKGTINKTRVWEDLRKVPLGVAEFGAEIFSGEN